MMPTQANTPAKLLSKELERREVLPTTHAVDILRQLAVAIAQRHESGSLHLFVWAGMVSYESDTGRAELREPNETGRALGGTNCDDEFCPPELQQSRPVLVPVDLAAARDALPVADWREC